MGFGHESDTHSRTHSFSSATSIGSTATPSDTSRLHQTVWQDLPAKMDKYDSGMTLNLMSCCTVPNVLVSGLINNVEFEAFEGWDAMLELIKQRRGAFQL